MPPRSPFVAQSPAIMTNMSFTTSPRASSTNSTKPTSCRFIANSRATKGEITKSGSNQSFTVAVNQNKHAPILDLLLSTNSSREEEPGASTTVFATRYNKLWAVSKAGACITVTYLGNYQDKSKRTWRVLSCFPPVRSTDSSIVKRQVTIKVLTIVNLPASVEELPPNVETNSLYPLLTHLKFRLNHRVLRMQALNIAIIEASAFVFDVVQAACLSRRAASSSEPSLLAGRKRNQVKEIRASRILPATHDLVLIVLDDGEHLEVEKGLLVHTSKYFGSIFGSQNNWLETNTGVVYLDGFEQATMSVYLHWLDTGNIRDTVDLLPAIPHLPFLHLPAPQTHAPVLVGNKSTVFIADAPMRIRSLVSAYLLGDYLGTPSFQNDIMDSLLLEYQNLYEKDNQIPLYNIPIITSNFGRASAIQKLVADAVYACLSPESMNKAVRMGLLNGDVTAAVASIGMGNEAVRRLGRDMPWDRLKCRYHVHPEGHLSGICQDMWSLEREFEEYLNPPSQSAWTNADHW
ncbi:hypothetical protein VTL71DRAFT_5183 [Oculimacula yallundae]|uniref:BTB domain-containing protein n=1 Tax=Oculimacula yallundae TaxID=86028 RepID=A0ABR4C0D4_9HELO